MNDEPQDGDGIHDDLFDIKRQSDEDNLLRGVSDTDIAAEINRRLFALRPVPVGTLDLKAIVNAAESYMSDQLDAEVGGDVERFDDYYDAYHTIMTAVFGPDWYKAVEGYRKTRDALGGKGVAMEDDNA